MVRAQSSCVPWGAADSLGRIVETSQSLNNIRDNGTVGIFYFLWINSSSLKAPWADDPYDVSKILERLPESDWQDPERSKSELWGPKFGTMYFCGEPIYGYYSAFDE